MILVYCLLHNDVGIDFNDFFTTPFSHPLEVICTNCVSLMLQPNQEVIFFQSEIIARLCCYSTDTKWIQKINLIFLFGQMIDF